MENTKAKIELFKKITDVHFATDYSSIDYLYPPLFVWPKVSARSEIRTGEFLRYISQGPYSLYIHFPFCRYKCAFCRQYSLAESSADRYALYSDLVIKELKLYSPHFCSSRLVGIYFGGGTPTLFNLEKVLKTIYANFNLFSPFYLNIESTPDSLTKKKLANLKKMGLTRLLIGVQSFDPKVLKSIGRPTFQFQIFGKIYNEILRAGIPYTSVELVCGLPNQNLESFLRDLRRVIGFKPQSIHIYPYLQTPLTFLGRSGQSLTLARRVLIDRMYKVGCQILSGAGYLYRGDDFCLSESARNPAISSPFRTIGTLAFGLSAISQYQYKTNFGLLMTANILSFNKYQKMILRNLFPLEKFYSLDSHDEIIRTLLLRFYRYGGLSGEELKNWEILKGWNLKKLYLQFKNEFSFLKKVNAVEIDDSFSRIVFSNKNWLVYSKIFFSPEVLEKCRQVINSRHYSSLP